MTQETQHSQALLFFEDGSFFYGASVGAPGIAVGEVCFTTAMMGYQESLSDPSYAHQILCFTFPHIGNIGINSHDTESCLYPEQACEYTTHPCAALFAAPPSQPSNYRAQDSLEHYLKSHNIVALAGLDTRALIQKLKQNTTTLGVVASFEQTPPSRAILNDAIEGARKTLDLPMCQNASCTKPYAFNAHAQGPLVVVIDYGVKHNILRHLDQQGLRVLVVPCTTNLDTIQKLSPQGLLLSNGPGNPVGKTYLHADLLAWILEEKIPTLGICLGYQLLAQAMGAKLVKMPHPHRGANHPVYSKEKNRVDIAVMNHGYAVERASLPSGLEETHFSLLDQSLCGFKHKNLPIVGLQNHPEASGGPHDMEYIFAQFASMIHEHDKGFVPPMPLFLRR